MVHHHSAARAVADAEQLMLPATLPPACYLACLLSLHPPSHCCACLGSANASTFAARRFSREQQRAQRLRPGVAAAATGLPVGGVAAAPATAASGPPPCSAPCSVMRAHTLGFGEASDQIRTAAGHCPFAPASTHTSFLFQLSTCSLPQARQPARTPKPATQPAGHTAVVCTSFRAWQVRRGQE